MVDLTFRCLPYHEQGVEIYVLIVRGSSKEYNLLKGLVEC